MDVMRSALMLVWAGVCWVVNWWRRELDEREPDEQVW